MSKGPGVIERAITDLFRASGWDGTDRTFTVDELCREVFDVVEPTRAHRVSVVRAARTAIRRDLTSWRASVRKDRSLIFHDWSHPVRVWAVEITREGLIWSEAEIVAITSSRISVAYKGARCPVHRPLGLFGSWWRGVRFVGERDGWTAERLEDLWRREFGHLQPARMALHVARAMLDLPEHYTRAAVLTAFRKAALRCHPDQGGTVEQFRALVEARDRLLAAIGTSAPPPKAPEFTPRGYRTVYTTVRSAAPRIGSGRRLLA